MHVHFKLGKDFRGPTLHFNQFTFYYREMVMQYEIKNIPMESERFKEILPGVFIKIHYGVHNRFKREILTLLSKFLPYVSTELINSETLHPVQIEFKIENLRDYIFISDGIEEYQNRDFEETNFYYYSHPLDRLNINLNDWEIDNQPTREYIDTEKVIFYPYMLGNGCIQRSVLSQWGLFQEYGDYSLFNLEEILTDTAKDPDVSAYCRNFGKCNELLEKFKTGTYDINHDQVIQVENYEDKYIVIEGKHRACLAKRFKIPQIHAMVTTLKKKEDEHQKNLKQYPPQKENKFDKWKIKSLYYETLNNVGLNVEQSRYILREGLSVAEIIKFIEKETCVSLYKRING